MISRLFSVLLAVLVLTGAAGAQGAYELDPQRSTVQFMSMKNGAVAELHHFRTLTGSVDGDGLASVVIDLDSVESLIPIRNERMRELLFDTRSFPSATVTAVVPSTLLIQQAGATSTAQLTLQVDLHGEALPLDATVTVTALEGGDLQVVLREPIVVKAADFKLAAGIEALRNIAGLKAIATAVPVNATLVFSPVD